MFPQALQQLSELVRRIADRRLLPGSDCADTERKPDGSLVTATDLVMQRELVAALHARWPDIASLGEEMSSAEQQAAMARRDDGVWCIDPLDGTSNFAAGIPYYAVSVALVKARRTKLGVVYDPNRGECFSAALGQGAWLNGERLEPRQRVSRLGDSMAMVDLKRLPPALAARLAARPPYKSQRSFGAVALDWCWLAAGRGDVYLHGRQKLWDYAAGLLVLEETGGQAVCLDGEPVFAATLEPRSAAAALDPGLFALWTAWLEIPADTTQPPLR